MNQARQNQDEPFAVARKGNMIVGFTGTRNGMTAVQREMLGIVLRELAPSEFHHGDCDGSDAQAANMLQEMNGPHICVHPPVDDAHRAFSPWGRIVAEPKTHFARNRDIVAVCELLVATPMTNDAITAKTRGGTAYTVNYARKSGKRIIIVWPDGRASSEFPTPSSMRSS